jgi:hypothetical protein
MKTCTCVSATRAWLHAFIIPHGICPFARPVDEQNRIRYAVAAGYGWEELLQKLVEEFGRLDADEETETTLLIFPEALADFDDYLDFLEIAQQLLAERGYEGIYQLASFHPHYRFADSGENDASNYTNRSPFPMLHIIRESSIELALRNYPDPDDIPRRNVRLTRQLGADKLKAILQACYQ